MEGVGVGVEKQVGANCTHGVGFGNWHFPPVFEKAVGLLQQGRTVKAL